jgi:hypothetical protein
LFVSGRGVQLVGDSLYFICLELNLLVYDLEVVIQKKGRKVMPILAASVAEDFSVVVQSDMDNGGKILWVLQKNGEISVQNFKEKGEVVKSTIKLPEIDQGTTLVYNTIEATQDFALVSAASTQSMKNFYYLVTPDQARKTQSPSLEVNRGKKRRPVYDLDDFIKTIKTFARGQNTYAVGVHVLYWLDIFAVDKKRCLHLLSQSYQVADDWIGGVLIDDTEFPSIRKLVIVAQQMYRAIDIVIN